MPLTGTEVMTPVNKKYYLIAVMLAFLIIGTFSGCEDKNAVQTVNATPEVEELRSICELATLECYYHNVAKSVKTKGDGISHIGEKERVFWIEYSGVAKVGIDMSKVKLEQAEEEGKYIVTIPKAELLSIKIDETSFTRDSYFTSQDGFWNKNPITAEDQTAALDAAQQHMTEQVEDNTVLLANAQDRAKKMIENYIDNLGEAAGIEYTIEWRYEE